MKIVEQVSMSWDWKEDRCPEIEHSMTPNRKLKVGSQHAGYGEKERLHLQDSYTRQMFHQSTE